MNVIEHKQRLARQLQAKRLVGKSGEMIFPEFDWDGLTRPPILNYLPIQVINQVDKTISNVKLMNNPTKKYKIVNELLKPYGFRHLASGTNRRCFYCEYDEGIVLKIASDSVGRKDNLSEYRLQNFIKPFCPKTFSVLPNGLIALSERVETMTEDEYKKVWAGDIFDFIFQIFLRGYIMEDVGANFFKNWGIRYGFGPVILDYPYIFEVDWTKLKCVREDPMTGTQCNGDLDYDYSRGMSEIVCKNCGTRYSARYLAKNYNSCFQDSSMRGDRVNMFMNDIKFHPIVSIVKGDKETPVNYQERKVVPTESIEVIDRPVVVVDPGRSINITPNFKETENKFNIKTNIIRSNKRRINTYRGTTPEDGSIQKQLEDNKIRANVVTSNIRVAERKHDSEKNTCYYEKQLFKDILFFLTKIEEKHGPAVAVELGDKLQVNYRPKRDLNEYNKSHKDFKPINIPEVPEADLSTTKIDVEKIKEEEEIINKEHEEEIVEVKEESWKKRSDKINSLDDELLKYAEESKMTVQTQEEETTTELNESTLSDESFDTEEETEEISVEEEVEEKKPFVLEVDKEDEKRDVTASKVDQVKPTHNLNVVKPKTAEEIAAEEMNGRNETAIMGFPGEPLVQTMKFEQEMPKLRDKVREQFEGFTSDSRLSEEDVCIKLEKAIKQFIFEDVKKLMPEESKNLNVSVKSNFDEHNTPCYNVMVSALGTYLFSTNLYKKDESEDLNDFEHLLSDPVRRNKTFAKWFEEYPDAENYDLSIKEGCEDLRSAVIGYIYAKFIDSRKKNIQYGQVLTEVLELVQTWVDENLQFEETNEDETSVEDEL